MRPLDWTYGAEHELADWDRGRILPDGFGIDRKDNTIVNSNGIAADPKGELYGYGGEVNTPPTDTPTGQAELLHELLECLPDATINYRSNLHVHVRIPGLKQNLGMLKSLADYNARWLRKVLPIIEPIPDPVEEHYTSRAEYEGARRRYRRRRRSHQTVLPASRLKLQLEAESIDEFFEAEVPQSGDGKPLWHLQPRAAVNVRQLLETDTIEFRHFPGTLASCELLTAVEWCRDYLLCWINGMDPVAHYERNYKHRSWPQFMPYVHWMEERYQLTARGIGIPIGRVRMNILDIIEMDGGESCEC